MNLDVTSRQRFQRQKVERGLLLLIYILCLNCSRFIPCVLSAPTVPPPLSILGERNSLGVEVGVNRQHTGREKLEQCRTTESLAWASDNAYSLIRTKTILLLTKFLAFCNNVYYSRIFFTIPGSKSTWNPRVFSPARSGSDMVPSLD